MLNAQLIDKNGETAYLFICIFTFKVHPGLKFMGLVYMIHNVELYEEFWRWKGSCLVYLIPCKSCERTAGFHIFTVETENLSSWKAPGMYSALILIPSVNKYIQTSLLNWVFCCGTTYFVTLAKAYCDKCIWILIFLFL